MYPHKYRYIHSTNQILLEYNTFKALKDMLDKEKEVKKLEEEKKRREEDEARTEALFQRFAKQFSSTPTAPATPISISAPSTPIPPSSLIERSDYVTKRDLETMMTTILNETSRRSTPRSFETPKRQRSPSPPPRIQKKEKAKKAPKLDEEKLEKATKAWQNWLKDKLHGLKTRDEWLKGITDIKKRFGEYVEFDFAGKRKEQAIEGLAKLFATKASNPDDKFFFSSDSESD